MFKFLINRVKNLIYFCFTYLFNMENIRKLIKETIEKVINEVAVSMTDVLGNPDIGLIVNKNAHHTVVVLYNFKTGRVIGEITYRLAAKGVEQFVGVAAEQGYGPLIYELGIMSAFNHAMVPTRDGDIRGGAFSVWEKFMNNPGFTKHVLSPDDEAYSEAYEEFGEKENVIGNTALIKSPDSKYSDLLNRSPELINKYRISAKEIGRRAGDYFAYKYADS